MISTRKIYIFRIDETYLNVKSRVYSVNLILQYENSFIDYLLGYNDYLRPSGNRTSNYEFKFETFNKDEILDFIKFVVNKWNIKDYLIENL